MPELRASKKKVNIDNTELEAAIAEMRQDFTPATQNKVINLALRANFYVPAILEKKQELVADGENHVKFQDHQNAKFILLNHKDKGTFFPAFTSLDELNKIKQTQKTPFVPFAMKFSDLAGIVEQTPNVSGFVINAFNQNLPFTKDILDSIKQTLIKVRQDREAAAAASASTEENSAPDITMTTNSEVTE